MSRSRSTLNKPMAEYSIPKHSKDANITHHKPHLFHTLSEAIAYALSKGFNNIDLHHVRRTLKEAREKNPLQRRNPHDWKAMVIKHERKDWFENNSGVTTVKILQIQRKMGDWLLRIVDTDEQGWHYGMSWESGSWNDPIRHRKKTSKTNRGTAKKVKVTKPKVPKKQFNRFSDIDVV